MLKGWRHFSMVETISKEIRRSFRSRLRLYLEAERINPKRGLRNAVQATA
jgi:hypothetical protein